MSIRISFFLIGILFFVGIESNTLSTENFDDRVNYLLDLIEPFENFNDTLTEIIANDSVLSTHKSEVMQFFNTFLSYRSLRSHIIEIYRDFYTLSDINGMIEFYSSPTGKKLLQTADQFKNRVIQLARDLLNEQKSQITVWFKKIFNDTISEDDFNQTLYSA